LLLVSIAVSARFAATIEIRIDIDGSYNVSELRGKAEKLDEMPSCHYSLTRRAKELKKRTEPNTPQYALLLVSIAVSSKITSTIEMEADIDASYNVLGLHGRAKGRDEMAS
jgi:hypothetical protein